MFYKKVANSVLKIELNASYSIFCFIRWNKNISKYIIKIYLTDSSSGLLYLIENDVINNTQFKSNEKNINTDITTFITDLFDKGFFQYYINCFKYIMKCFDYGDIHYEKEKI